jgi:hypothetical protein
MEKLRSRSGACRPWLLEVLDVDDLGAEARAVGMTIWAVADALALRGVRHLVVAVDAGLLLGLAGLGALADPFELALEGLCLALSSRASCRRRLAFCSSQAE